MSFAIESCWSYSFCSSPSVTFHYCLEVSFPNDNTNHVTGVNFPAQAVVTMLVSWWSGKREKTMRRVLREYNHTFENVNEVGNFFDAKRGDLCFEEMQREELIP